MEHQITITWGNRVNAANMFPTIGSLEVMHRSRICRGVLVDNVSAEDKAKNSISQNALGKWMTDKPKRESTLTINDAEVSLFAAFIEELSIKEQIPMVMEEFFSEIMALRQGEETDGEEGGE